MIVRSLLDNDFYKFTMMHAVRQSYPDAQVSYQFTNRDPQRTFPPEFLPKLQEHIQALASLQLSDTERDWLASLNHFPQHFIDFLYTFRFNPDLVSASLSPSGQLSLSVAGSWLETILFEVPLLAIISELTFQNTPCDLDDYAARTKAKGLALAQENCTFADYGTRRRRSYDVQDTVIRAFTQLPKPPQYFAGTSNVHLAHKYDISPVGTMAHEWIMGHAGLYGVPGSNTRALQTWHDVYQGKFSIALTDTYGTGTFFSEFTPELAKSFWGVRQDSGSPTQFVDNALAFYKDLSIDPLEKYIVFSDSLNWQKAIDIKRYCRGRINTLFGIGTHFTNDVPGQRPLNIVIKLATINGTSVYKTTDDASKATGLS